MIELKPFIHHAVELEDAVLGACLLEGDAMARVYDRLKAPYFYRQDNQRVYAVLREMFENSRPIDLLTASYELAGKGATEVAGYSIAGYLTRLTNSVVNTSHLEYHAHLLCQMWKRRRILELKFSPLADPVSVDENLADIRQQILDITDTTVEKEWYDMEELMYRLILHQHEMAQGKVNFITTSFRKLDELNTGFFPGQMVIIAARPSVGKSALMGKMAVDIARQGKKVGILSLEMSNTEIAGRLAAIDTSIDFKDLFTDLAKDEERHKQFYEMVSASTVKLPIYLSDKAKVTMPEIRAKAMKLQRSRGCDLLMIDYLQLIDTSDKRMTIREQQVAELSRGIKLMAKEMKIPVIILCQLNRESVKRDGKNRYPRLSDLRESGSLEQDADVVMFLHRDFMIGMEVDEHGNSTEFNADLVIPKWRNGKPCHLELDFSPTKMMFMEKRGSSFRQYHNTDNYQNDKPF